MAAATNANESRTRGNSSDLNRRAEHRGSNNYRGMEGNYVQRDKNYRPGKNSARPEGKGYRPQSNSARPEGKGYRPQSNSARPGKNCCRPEGNSAGAGSNNTGTRENDYRQKDNYRISYSFSKNIDKDEDNETRGTKGHKAAARSSQSKDKEQQPDKLETIRRLEREKKAVQRKNREEDIEKPKRQILKQKRSVKDWTRGYEYGLLDEEEDYSGH